MRGLAAFRQNRVASCLGVVLSLIGCSDEPAERAPNVYADMRWRPEKTVTPTSVIATHTYTCESNRVIAIQFLGDGVSLLLHTPAQQRPTRLRAPRQGASFHGPRRLVLTLHGHSILLQQDGLMRRCERDRRASSDARTRSPDLSDQPISLGQTAALARMMSERQSHLRQVNLAIPTSALDWRI